MGRFTACAVLAAAFLSAGETVNMIRNGNFTTWENGLPLEWKLEADRVATTPGISVRTDASGRNGAALHAQQSGLSNGRLVQVVPVPDLLEQNEQEEQLWLHFSCTVTLAGDQCPLQNILIGLFWEKSLSKGSGWGPPVRHFVPLEAQKDTPDSYRAEIDFPVVQGAGNLRVVLAQFGGTEGAATFSDVSLEAAPAPPPRVVRIATAYYMPKGRGDWKRNLAGIEQLTAQAAAQDCDLILFGEGVTVVGSGKSYVDVAEPIPGPASNDLAAIAATHNIFLVAGLYERDGDAAYNTAVMFDRQGKLAGKYRKVHLPHPELFAGLKAGDSFPVFDTELGRIGLQICYDHHFQESSRALAVAGAEIILTPIWGDMRSDGECYDAVAQARALDNGVFYVMSVYSMRRSLIVDPHGRILAKTSEKDEPNLAIADCDLNQLYRLDWPYRIPPNIQQGFRVERRPSAYRTLCEP